MFQIIVLLALLGAGDALQDVIVDEPVSVDEAPLHALAAASGVSVAYLERSRQVLSAHAQPVFSDIDPSYQEKVEKIILNNKGYQQTKPSIVDLNSEMLPYLHKGDLMLSEQQLDMLETEMKGEKHSSRARRLAPLTFANLWDTSKPIPYRFEDSLQENGRSAVKAATELLSNRSCISFVHNPSSDYGLSFFSGPGCYSTLGQVRSGWQQISLGRGCESTAIATHEILHALGSDHEQDRSDRNNYVSINEAVVPANRLNNFQLRTPEENDNLGTPYDFGSLMHYGAFDFSTVKGTPAIIAKDILYTQSMGQRRFIAFNDLKTLNKLYKCNEKCASPPRCQNGGYVHPKDCSKCVCNDFYKGSLCEASVSSYDLALKTKLKVEYVAKENVDFKPESEWALYDKAIPKIISAPVGKRLNVTIASIYAWNMCHRACPLLGVELVEGDDLTRGGKTFCCNTDAGQSFITNTNTLGIKAFNVPGELFKFILEIRAV